MHPSDMRARALAAQPNPGHLALAMFSVPSVREKIAPGASFTLITQNVDGLHLKTIRHVWSEPQQNQAILELHGTLHVRCLIPIPS